MATKNKVYVCAVVLGIIILWEIGCANRAKAAICDQKSETKESLSKSQEQFALGGGGGIGIIKWNAFIQINANVPEATETFCLFAAAAGEGPKTGYTPQGETENSKVTTLTFIGGLGISKWHSRWKGTNLGGFVGLGFDKPSYGNTPYTWGYQTQVAYTILPMGNSALSVFVQAGKAFLFTSQDKRGLFFKSNTNSDLVLKYGARYEF